jgi:hypothetical protein
MVIDNALVASSANLVDRPLLRRLTIYFLEAIITIMKMPLTFRSYIALLAQILKILNPLEIAWQGKIFFVGETLDKHLGSLDLAMAFILECYSV